MKFRMFGDSPVREILLSRLKYKGHEKVLAHEAEILIDAESDYERKYEATSWDASDTSAFYCLCYGAAATKIAARTKQSKHVVGFSLIPPFTNSSILEIARPLQTPVEELEKARSFFESLGFTVVEVPDGPGLIQARIVACLANEAFSALSEGVADAKTIDTAMKLGTNYPLGPLEWAEFLGLESILAIMEGLQSEYGEDRYRPHPLLRRLVAANMSIAQFEAWKRG